MGMVHIPPRNDERFWWMLTMTWFLITFHTFRGHSYPCFSPQVGEHVEQVAAAAPSTSDWRMVLYHDRNVAGRDTLVTRNWGVSIVTGDPQNLLIYEGKCLFKMDDNGGYTSIYGNSPHWISHDFTGHVEEHLEARIKYKICTLSLKPSRMICKNLR